MMETNDAKLDRLLSEQDKLKADSARIDRMVSDSMAGLQKAMSDVDKVFEQKRQLRTAAKFFLKANVVQLVIIAVLAGLLVWRW